MILLNKLNHITRLIALTTSGLLITITILTAQSGPENKMSILFEHMIKKDLLCLDSSYTNNFGETFIPKNFKYYISDLGVVDHKGHFSKISDNSFLVDESEVESKKIEFLVAPGTYSNIRFVIGVDSLRTVSGVHEGALDPYHGMFWTWNTGFVSAKLEGFSPASNMPQQMFQYHIGGFRTGQNTIRTIDIPFTDTLVLKSGVNTTITITADILKWFNGKHDLKIAAQAFVHSPGKIAIQYADNYSSMFQLKSIVQD